MSTLINALVAKIPLWLSLPLLVVCFLVGSFFNTSHYKIGLNEKADLAKIVESNDIAAFLSVIKLEEDKSATEAMADTAEKEDKTFSDLIGDFEISYDIKARRKSDNAMVFRFDNSQHFEYPEVTKSVSHNTKAKQEV